jgi:hypothetical protein
MRPIGGLSPATKRRQVEKWNGHLFPPSRVTEEKRRAQAPPYCLL